MGLRVLLVLSVFLALPAGAHAANFTRADGAVTMDDGVSIAYTLYEPTTARPAAGWPAIVMFHGLGGKHQDMNTLAENSFANEGYAVLTFDARGHGVSGGLFSLDGPREIADLQDALQLARGATGDRRHADRRAGASRSAAAPSGTRSSTGSRSRPARWSRPGPT